ncbi:DUF805 domain-containing protein [Maritalea porphyrae]|uniref:DUF805 domain-containing protein n=1 Tax=Maritalea porphyrae TaxID=880732 RepID=A0ABQ5UNT0_9HYPH|nr:DUF805 domain-containing protein [Maritalea porphyrae]GLQ16909.1 DUF805 domain-containing protein [Maritalea porphyrae]
MELFTSFEGRISRKSFWIGILGIGLISLVLAFGIYPLLSSGGIVLMLAQLILTIAIFYLWSAVLIKRLHDRDKSAVPWAIIFMGPSAIMSLMSIFRIDYTAMDLAGTTLMVPGAIAMGVTWISTAVSLWMIVELGFLKGTPGQNRFGMNPLAGPDGVPEGSSV